MANESGAPKNVSQKISYYRFIRFISSLPVFVALLVPSFALDYLLFEEKVTFFFWFIILYGFFVLPLSYSFHYRGGKQRLIALESGNAEVLNKQESKDTKRYLAILAALVAILLYGMWRSLL